MTEPQQETVARVEPVSGPTPAQQVAAHSAAQGHKYIVHFPEHGAREGDPHYKDFHAFHRKYFGTDKWVCFIGERVGSEHCTTDQPLEIHHSHVEWSLLNGVDLKALERDYPGVSDPDEVGAWVESEKNLRILCQFHHRGAGGAHTAAHADWEASQYVIGLIDPIAKP